MESSEPADLSSEDLNIKQEFDSNEDFIIQIKNETEDISETTDNPFEDLQIEIKNEMPMEKELQNDIEKNINVELEIETVKHEPMEVKQHEITVINVKKESTESILPNDEGEEIDNDLVDCNYPNFDDSMDSSEAAALSKVEACLNEEVHIKTERDDNHKADIPIKEESDITVTETHLISKKLINTRSTVTSNRGVIESQTTNTLVMEIHPVSQDQTYKMGNPEEILSTSDNVYKVDYRDFQLNSITGNVLSLEQEAYGLLKSKKQVAIEGYTQKCPKCVKWFRTKYNLKKHLRVHESIEKRAMGIIKGQKKKTENMIKKKMEISVCQEEDDVKIKKEEGYKCTCGKEFQRRSRMETCLRSHTLFSETCQYECASCQKKFKAKEALIYHRNKYHRKKFPCKFCPTDYHTQKELFKHLQVHRRVQLMEYKVMGEITKGNQELKCPICSKIYKSLPDLKSHIMDDHNNPYNCPNCNKVFTKIIDFVDHTRKDHPDVGSQTVLDVVEAFSKLVKAWKCEECAQQFHEADKLALHQIETHTPEMKNEQHFQCEDCQRVFVSNQGLNSHRRMHHRVEPTEPTEPEEIGVMCLACRKMCKDMTALTSHMRLHSMDRKFPCKFCDFRFATQQKRKAHAEIHTGDMKYVCFICEYQCSSENRLKVHKMSIKHLNMKEYLLTGKPLIEEPEPVAKKKKNKDKGLEIACDICGEKFKGEKDMMAHKLTHPFIEFPNDDKPSRIFFK